MVANIGEGECIRPLLNFMVALLIDVDIPCTRSTYSNMFNAFLLSRASLRLLETSNLFVE